MNCMKRLIAFSAVMFLCGTAVFAGSSSITITAPVVASSTVTQAELVAAINAAIKEQFDIAQADLNKDYFSKFHDQTELARGFANSGAATSQNASIMGYQNYDLFCVMLGGNMGFAYPSMSASETAQAFKDIKNKGDVYAGINTGGFAGQVGINSSFLFKDLYLSAKFGTYSYSQKFGDTSIDLDQMMFGVGANYRLFSTWDFAWGLAKWRGLSLGTGLIYNSSSVKVKVPVSNQAINVSYTDTTYGTGTYDFSGEITDINARLAIESSSIVIPFDVTTSVQALWLFNFGVGAGLDLIIPTSTIKVGGSANAYINDDNGNFTTQTPGRVSVVGTNSENELKFTDVIAPRLSADVGLNLSVVKIDLMGNWYPFSKAIALGLSAGVVW